MPNQNKQRAFTIVELLVAAGIIVILVSILVPLISRSFRQSQKFRTQADFQAIAQAIETYKQEFGDIPRIPAGGRSSGAAILGKALLGPFGDGLLPVPSPSDPPQIDPNDPPAFSNSASYKVGECVVDSGRYWVALKPLASGMAPAIGADWAAFDPRDNLDGPGFRLRSQGKTYGPYMDMGKVKHSGAFLLDSHGSPILYAPAKPGRSDVSKQPVPASDPGPYVDLSQAGRPLPLFDAYDNIAFFYRSGESTPAMDKVAASRMQIMMGDYKFNGYIESASDETSISKEYILWSAGPDGSFGPVGFTPGTDAEANRKAVSSCDDVTNFN